MNHWTSDTTLLIILIGLAILALFLAAMLYAHRRWSLQRRLVIAAVLFFVSTELMVYLITGCFQKSGGHLFAGIILAFWLSQSLVAFYVWRKVSRQARRAAAVGRPPPDNVDQFFWQGLLILLPVVFMALVAGTAIIKDRATVEREARQRAEEILQQINGQSATRIGFGLRFDEKRAEYEATLQNWTERNLENKIFPPRSIFRSGENVLDNSILAKWRADVPLLLIENDSIKFWPTFNADGGTRPLWSSGDFKSEPPQDAPPSPPEWFVELTPEQLVAWDVLSSAAAASTTDAREMKALLQKFKETHPSWGAVENAEFLECRVQMSGKDPAEAISQLLLSRYSRSESGIPLSSLALAEALKRAVEAGPLQSLWEQVALDTRVSPSLFTPVLLNLAEPVFGKDAVYSDCLKALNSRWAALEQMWAVGEVIQQSGKLQGPTPTNFWLNFDGSRWFCELLPDGASISSHIFPISVIKWAFKRAFQEMDISVPRYMEVTAEMQGGEPVSLWSEIGQEGHSRGVVLAEATGQRTSEAVPPYTLRVYLADASLMLAAHKQRVWVFSGLIFGSAAAAFIGYLAARRAFYRQLRLNEMKSDFVSSVSHELRAPIASVRLMAEGLEHGRISEPGKQHEYYKFIVQECRRLSSLIENVLDFSRIEQGRKQYEMESTDLVALTEKTVTLMETYAAERQIGIILKKTGEPAPLEMDGKAMQQALVNLIDNAIKHSPKGSEITVGLDFLPPDASRPGPRACLWVEDVGEGIPTAEHEKIFERFYRVGSELRRETQGVGIGLSIVKHIVEAHSGRVTLRSAPGQGSRFTIELPTK